MKIFDWFFHRRVDKGNRSQRYKKTEFIKQLWDTSPQSKCGVCGENARGLAGGILIMDEMDIDSLMSHLGEQRVICSDCGFVGHRKCCFDNAKGTTICPVCGGQMEEG